MGIRFVESRNAELAKYHNEIRFKMLTLLYDEYLVISGIG